MAHYRIISCKILIGRPAHLLRKPLGAPEDCYVVVGARGQITWRRKSASPALRVDSSVPINL